MLVENEVEEDQHNPAGAPQPLTTNADDKKRLACPYYKRYPNKFKRQRTCFGPGFIGIHRLKEHLCRRHGSPPHSCNRCLRGFDTPEALSEHQRALSVCSVASDQQVEGKMTAVQQRELQSMRRTRGRTIEDKWREIYRILFPESNPRSIPSPYFEDEETEREHLSLSDSPEAPDVRIAHGTFSPSLVRTFKTEIFRLLNSHYSDAVAMKGLDHGSAVVERLNGGRKSFRLKLSDDSTMELYDNTAMAEKLYTCVCKFFRPKV
ncbi:hypothetical protein F5Y04DRAFT_246221 [Hypomontagnella monticulosa]|nr:hypothetical protein F5Y04DRAFT_246221 [Hypomontagnella monticulosa]